MKITSIRPVSSNCGSNKAKTVAYLLDKFAGDDRETAAEFMKLYERDADDILQELERLNPGLCGGIREYIN